MGGSIPSGRGFLFGCGSRIGLPVGDSAVVFATVFVVDDEGFEAVSQTLYISLVDLVCMRR